MKEMKLNPNMNYEIFNDIIKNIFDSHAHYNDKRFDDNRVKLLDNFPKNGIDKIINVGANLKESMESIKLADSYDYIHASVGIHPYEIENLPENYLDQLSSLADHHKVVAIGEIGLDYHNNSIDKSLQKKIFKEQLALAHDLKLPVIIHSRKADADMIDILKSFKISGVIHCFSSSAEIAKIFIDMGFFLGFTGAVTFKNNSKQVNAILNSPIEKILIETDAPYMAPEPFRGYPAISSMLTCVIHKISEIKNIKPQEIANITNQNARNLFNITN